MYLVLSHMSMSIKENVWERAKHFPFILREGCSLIYTLQPNKIHGRMKGCVKFKPGSAICCAVICAVSMEASEIFTNPLQHSGSKFLNINSCLR